MVIWTNATVPALKGNDDDAVTQTAGGKRDGMALEARDESKGKEMTKGAAQILNQGCVVYARYQLSRPSTHPFTSAVNVTVLNTTLFGTNILVSTVDAVLRPPGPLTQVLNQPENNLTSFAALLNNWNVTGDMGGAWVDGGKDTSGDPALMGLFNRKSGLFASGRVGWRRRQTLTLTTRFGWLHGLRTDE